MKKFILSAIFLSLLSMASAQGFRTFVDVFAGRTLFSSGKHISVDNYEVFNIKEDLGFGLYVTEGYQITPQWFAGVGVGGYTTMLGWTNAKGYPDYLYDDNSMRSIYLPVYADVRWTLNIEKTITPFVDFKIGYQFGVDLGAGNMGWDYYNMTPGIGYKGTMLLQPGVGVRFGKDAAFNLGLSYNAIIGKKIIEWSATDIGQSREVSSINTGMLILTLGADF